MSRFLGTLALVGAGIWLFSKMAVASDAVVADRRTELASTAQRLHSMACSLLGIAEVPLRFTDTVPNAASDGHAVLVNLTWFDDLLQRYCNDTVCVQNVVIGILGHEIGHHIRQHAPRGGNPHDNELEADRIAGVVLAWSGGTSQHLEALLRELSPRWTSSHPAFQLRVQAVRNGFDSPFPGRAY